MMTMHRMKLYMLGGAVAALLLGGCSEDWGLDESEVRRNVPTDFINFTTSLNPITANVTTRSNVGKLSVESEDWVIEGKSKADTRATLISSFSGNAGIIGYTQTGEASATLVNDLKDKSFTFDQEALSATSDPVPWKTINSSDIFNVYAYAPFVAITGEDSSGAALDGGTSQATGITQFVTSGTSPSLNYTVPTDVAAQSDLIVAKATAMKASSEYRKTVNLNFSHALTAIRFRVGFECYVKSVTIEGAYCTGTYDFTSGTWSSNTPKNFPLTVSDTGVHFDKNALLTDDSENHSPLFMVLLPQTLPIDNPATAGIYEGVKVKLNYSTTQEGEYQDLVATIDGQVWEPGKMITYTINKNETIEYIYFDLAAGNVTIQASGSKYVYTGYVYTNGNGAKATVTGDHNSANKYYVYQSTAANRNSTGWSGAVGSTMTLPSYPTVLSPDGDGKTWSQFVTNNPDAERIVGLWNDGSPASTHPLRQAGRTATSNEIKFTAAASPGDLLIDMVIDNIWLQNDSYYTSTKSNKDGPFFLNGQNNAAHVGLDLRLKGDNFINRIIFDMRNTADYFRVTSFDGDNSINGSLTVTPKNANPYDDDYGMFGAVQSLDNSSKDHYGLEFNGGTTYVAGQLNYGNLSSMPAVACVGGGPNGNIRNLRITGGILTVVAHCTGAAIGGGGGFTGRGGDADIFISGGQTYAYQFGGAVRYKRPEWASLRDLVITATAIGGGSSFTSSANEGNVTIEGDAYVYAQSVGGVAIGGGSSGGLKGGSANITIQGNPTIIAKSIIGTITDPTTHVTHTVSAGTSIGGGSGGDEDNSYTYDVGTGYDPDAVANGGSAIITMQGSGVIYAGSIGGGKNGFMADAEGGGARLLGSATVNLSGNVLVQGQFIMEAPDAETAPTFTMTGGTLQPNKAGDVFHYVKPNGGAVWIDGGTFSLSGTGIIKDFSVSYDAGSGDGGLGGAVYMQSTRRASAFNMSGGTIRGCSAIGLDGINGLGGAVYMSGGSFTMSGGTIGGGTKQANLATNGGGGVYITGGSVLMQGGTISYNRSTAGSGGGIDVLGGTFTMNSETETANINNNFAYLNGGGVNVTSSEVAHVTVSKGNINSNYANNYGGGLCVIPTQDAVITFGEAEAANVNTQLKTNTAGLAGGGMYARGPHANITIHSGTLSGNSVIAAVPNQDVANEGGEVTLSGSADVTKVLITFNKNADAAVVTGSTTQYVVKATNSLLAPPTVTRENYTFVEWNTRIDGSGTVYASGDSTRDIAGDITLYAIWRAGT